MAIRATLKITRWDAQRFSDRIPRILTAYGQALNTQLQDEIQASQFTWPRTTRRRNGQWVSSPRDIYDSGEFYRSQTLTSEGRNRLAFRWNPIGADGQPYAVRLFTGWIGPGGVLMPGRDWISPALANRPPERFFAEQWRALGR